MFVSSGLKAEFHDQVVDEFRRADEQHVDSGAVRVRRAVAEWIVATRDEFGEQSALIAREAGKSRRHIPLRRLFKEAPDMLTALKPCWAMSPLVVSQLLPGDRQYFDVVVFDEASQVTPADAIPAILRASRSSSPATSSSSRRRRSSSAPTRTTPDDETRRGRPPTAADRHLDRGPPASSRSSTC